MDQHFLSSSFRERLIEHLFISELLKVSWRRRECRLEVLKPEVDSRGYDVVAERDGVIRHIQLKTSHLDARTTSQKVHVALCDKPSGCVVWIRFDEQSLDLGPYLFYGASAGKPMPSLSSLQIALHTKGNKDGKKGLRPGLRVIPRSAFTPIATIPELFDTLFLVKA